MILANLRHARERGAREVFLLDPTMNQRKDFADFLRVLAEGNPGRQFSYFGELRGEGVTEATARLLAEANFTEVEVGLQSIDPDAMKKMDRNNNLRAFERGVRAMMDQGIAVKVDLIVGLPGDTVESVRRGLHYLHDSGLYSEVQVFNLSILPGTAFRQEAAELGLTFQPRPPYYLLRTPTLSRQNLYTLMQEAQELFDIEFDAQPAPILDFDADSLSPSPPTPLPRVEGRGEPRQPLTAVWRVDLDDEQAMELPAPERWQQAFTLWLSADEFLPHQRQAAELIRQVLDANPFTTLQVVLEPGKAGTAGAVQNSLPLPVLETLTATCQANPTYLDRFYALQPGRANGAKRLIVQLPGTLRGRLEPQWIEDVGQYATLSWSGLSDIQEAELEDYEYAWCRQ